MQLGQLLADLGKNADEVAAALQANGIQGVRNTVRFLNPIVRYAQNHLRADEYAFDLMQPGVLRLVYPDGTKTETPLPPAVMQFLDAFDKGVYGHLELSSP